MVVGCVQVMTEGLDPVLTYPAAHTDWEYEGGDPRILRVDISIGSGCDLE